MNKLSEPERTYSKEEITPKKRVNEVKDDKDLASVDSYRRTDLELRRSKPLSDGSA